MFWGESNRSFWSFLTKSKIKQTYRTSSDVLGGVMFDLVYQENNTVPPFTPITTVWNKNWTHYDSTCDDQNDHHHVSYSDGPIEPDEYF